MHKRGRIEVEFFIVLITIVVTSAVILLLVKFGTIEVREEAVAEPVLNAEFLPTGKEGFLAMKDFAFCSYVDADLNCVGKQEDFSKGEDVYVWFVVESSVIDRRVMLLRNYEMRDPAGELVLQAEQKNAYNFELSSQGKTEEVVFGEFFLLGDEAIAGEYTLDIIVENLLLEKKITITRKFMLTEGALS